MYIHTTIVRHTYTRDAEYNSTWIGQISRGGCPRATPPDGCPDRGNVTTLFSSFFVLRLSQESDPFSAILLQCFPLHCPHRRTCMHTSCIMLKNDQSKESSFEFWPQCLLGNCRWGKMGGVKVELWEATFCQKNCRIIFRKSLNIALEWWR